MSKRYISIDGGLESRLSAGNFQTSIDQVRSENSSIVESLFESASSFCVDIVIVSTSESAAVPQRRPNMNEMFHLFIDCSSFLSISGFAMPSAVTGG